MTVEYKILVPRAVRDAITPITEQVASQLLAMCIAGTPVDSGELRNGWRKIPGRAPGAFIIENTVAHGRYVEHGTDGTPGSFMLGRAAATIRGRYGSR